MTQQEFAKALSTTTASINRWENRESVPNNMAQKQIYSLCESHSFSPTSLMLQKYNAQNKHTLYHGSKKGIEGQLSPSSRPDCDFGKGFYMGNDPLQPLTLICGEENPVFYVLDVDFSKLKIKEIPLGLDWATLIAYHRGYMDEFKNSPLYSHYAHYLDGYDLAKGYIADDRLYVSLTRFFEGGITDEALLHCLSALSLGEQYVALNEKGCSSISIIEEHKLSLLELLSLQSTGLERRKEGLAITKEVEIKYRRVGRYYDEIMGEKDHADTFAITLCRCQGELFETSFEEGYSSEIFIKTFMKSNTASLLDKPYNHLQWAGKNYIKDNFLLECSEKLTKNGKPYYKEILYWIGYIYRYWHYYTSEDSKTIVKIAPPSLMANAYLAYHTMSPEMAIDRIKEQEIHHRD